MRWRSLWCSAGGPSFTTWRVSAGWGTVKWRFADFPATTTTVFASKRWFRTSLLMVTRNSAMWLAIQQGYSPLCFWLCLRSQGELVWYFASILISIMCQRVVDCVVLLHDQKAGGNMTRVNICLNAIIKPLQNKISHQPYVGFPAVVPSTVRFCSCRLLLRPAANSCTQSTSMCERIK